MKKSRMNAVTGDLKDCAESTQLAYDLLTNTMQNYTTMSARLHPETSPQVAMLGAVTALLQIASEVALFLNEASKQDFFTSERFSNIAREHYELEAATEDEMKNEHEKAPT